MNSARASEQPKLLKAAVALLVGRALIGLAALPIAVEDPDDAMTVRVVGSLFITLSLIFAYFIWNRRRWAAWAALALMVIDILLTLPIFVASPGVAFSVLGGIAIVTAVAVIVALRHRSVWPLLD